jgi:hypothetical protein
MADRNGNYTEGNTGMTRRLMVSLYIGLAALAACGGGTHATNALGPGKQVGKEAGTGGDDEYKDATMPPLAIWDHQAPPKPADKQVYLIYPAEKQGQWICVLADYGQGKLPWGAVLDRSSLAEFLERINDLAGQLDIGRVPPPPPPPGGDHGWAVRALQRAARVGPALAMPEIQ